MAKRVTLSDAAYAALRRQKAPSESMSEAVLRLAGEARHTKRDPMRFVRDPPGAGPDAAGA